MTFLQVVVLAVIQGLGEVLPVGASGHLAALRGLTEQPEAMAAVTVAAHIGILVALCLYFWRDIGAMGLGVWRLAKGRSDAGTRLLLHVAAGSLPAIAIGWAFLGAGGGTGGTVAAAAAMMVFGLFLLVADHLGVTVRRVEHLTLAAAVGIGILQAAALIPGVSRTGLTVTAARLLGYERHAAARLSLLLAIPVFAVHAGRTLWALSHQAELILSADLALAAAVAGLAALAATAAMMGWLRRNTYTPFAVWQLLFGAAACGLALWLK